MTQNTYSSCHKQIKGRWEITPKIILMKKELKLCSFFFFLHHLYLTKNTKIFYLDLWILQRFSNTYYWIFARDHSGWKIEISLEQIIVVGRLYSQRLNSMILEILFFTNSFDKKKIKKSERQIWQFWFAFRYTYFFMI